MCLFYSGLGHQAAMIFLQPRRKSSWGIIAICNFTLSRHKKTAIIDGSSPLPTCCCILCETP